MHSNFGNIPIFMLRTLDVHYQWQRRRWPGASFWFFSGTKSHSIKRNEKLLFSLLYCLALFLALQHHILMATLVLCQMLNNGRQEREEMARQGMRLATLSSTTAVKRATNSSRNIYCEQGVYMSQ